MKIYIIWFAWLGLFLRKLSIQKKVVPNNSYHCEIVILINLIMTGIIPTAQSDCESDLDLDLDFRFIDLHWFAFCYLFIALLLLSLKFNCCLVVVVVVAVVVAILFVLSLAVFFDSSKETSSFGSWPLHKFHGRARTFFLAVQRQHLLEAWRPQKAAIGTGLQSRWTTAGGRGRWLQWLWWKWQRCWEWSPIQNAESNVWSFDSCPDPTSSWGLVPGLGESESP